MLQKVLLVILIALTGFSIFMINKINNKIQPNAEHANHITAESPEVMEDMPKVWAGAPNLENTKVYLSYDSSALELATEVYNKLTLEGFLVFMPQSGRSELKNDEEAIKALTKGEIFIMIYNEEYKHNHTTNQEFGSALVGKKKIIGIITERIPDVIKYTENIIFFETAEEEKNMMEDLKKFL